MAQRKNTRDRIRWSHGTEQDPNEAIAESKTPEVNLSGGVYRASSPTYTDGDNAVMHFDVNGKLETTASISGDVNVDNNSVDTSGLVGKSGGGDFTTAYASATTITLGTMPYTHTTIADDIISVMQVNTGGTVVNTFTRDDKTMSVTTNVLTVTGAAFAASDTFIVYTNIARDGVKSVANTARTTGTFVQPVQLVDATGEVQPAGESSGNPIYVDVINDPETITGISDGRTEVTTAGTRVVLAAATTCKEVTITAETNNTNMVVVGGSTVVAALATRQGTPLNAGDSVTLKIDDLNDIYVDSLVSTEGVTYTYLT